MPLSHRKIKPVREAYSADGDGRFKVGRWLNDRCMPVIYAAVIYSVVPAEVCLKFRWPHSIIKLEDG
jgi:RES domain-containing protein